MRPPTATPPLFISTTAGFLGLFGKARASDGERGRAAAGDPNDEDQHVALCALAATFPVSCLNLSAILALCCTRPLLASVASKKKERNNLISSSCEIQKKVKIERRAVLRGRMAVRLRVLYFAAAREAAGVESEEVSLEEEGTDDRGTPYATTEALEELLVSVPDLLSSKPSPS